MRSPILQFQPVSERFQATHALAIEPQVQASLSQETCLKSLHGKVVFQRGIGLNHFIPQIEVEFFDRQFSIEFESLFFEVTEVYQQWHKSKISPEQFLFSS